MKLFFKYIAGAFLFVILIFVCLDFVYTKIYKNNVVSNKVKYLMSLENQHFDAVFLGSSRVDNHIVSSEFENLGFNVVNAGIQGVNLKDNYLFLKTLVANKVTFDRLFVQIDYSYNQSDLSQVPYTEMLPYFRDPVIKNFSKDEFKDFNSYYYIPFYRYAVNDFRIGFRGIIAGLFSEKRVNGKFEDYKALYGTSKMALYELPTTFSDKPNAFNRINSFCEKNNIEVIYFTAPFCSELKSSTFTTLLAEKIPNYNDYSSLFNNDALFKNCGHLNNKGAVNFSKKIISDYFTK